MGNLRHHFAGQQEKHPMAMSIRPIDPHKPDFVGEVEGIDLSRSPEGADIQAIQAGMDRFAVLVFHDQRLDDEQQLRFSRPFGNLALDDGDLR
jgi:alpha-ketoglutarate-dependent 2,4-dichlorophenoxyacetate dioxygenase